MRQDLYQPDMILNLPLAREEMKKFLEKHRQNADFSVVRTRINNERARIEKRIHGRMKTLQGTK